MSHEFLDYVEDILDAMEKAELLVQEITFEQFEADFRIHYAVTRALEIIGEATKRLPDSIRKTYEDIPWIGMAGMRDRIIHAYDTVDLEIVWEVVVKDIPILKPKIKEILKDYEERSP